MLSVGGQRKQPTILLTYEPENWMICNRWKPRLTWFSEEQCPPRDRSDQPEPRVAWWQFSQPCTFPFFVRSVGTRTVLLRWVIWLTGFKRQLIMKGVSSFDVINIGAMVSEELHLVMSAFIYHWWCKDYRSLLGWVSENDRIRCPLDVYVAHIHVFSVNYCYHLAQGRQQRCDARHLTDKSLSLGSSRRCLAISWVKTSSVILNTGSSKLIIPQFSDVAYSRFHESPQPQLTTRNLVFFQPTMSLKTAKLVDCLWRKQVISWYIPSSLAALSLFRRLMAVNTSCAVMVTAGIIAALPLANRKLLLKSCA